MVGKPLLCVQFENIPCIVLHSRFLHSFTSFSESLMNHFYPNMNFDKHTRTLMFLVINKSVCIAKLKVTCKQDSVGIWNPVFPHGLPRHWFYLTACKPSLLKSSQKQSHGPLHFFPHHKIWVSKNEPRREGKIFVDLFAGYISKKPLPTSLNYLRFCGLY